MRSQASNKDQVQADAARLRGVLGDPRLQDVIERAARQVPGEGAARDKISALLSVDIDALVSSGGHAAGVPYLSRAPLVSMMQSQTEEALDKAGVPDPAAPASWWSKLVRAVERLLHLSPGSFMPNDPDWDIGIARGVLERLAMGNAPFNPAPAEYDGLTDDARLVVVGDWGTGLPRALDVAAHMHEAIGAALASGRRVHVLHLGDVYYSGFESEDRNRFLDPWPVTQAQAAAGVTSWSLNGNHDMYSGGFGYFGTLLGDDRFRAQRSPDGKPTSFFRLRSPSWDFLGLDTAWDTDVTSQGQVAVLQDPQATYAAQVAPGRRASSCCSATTSSRRTTKKRTLTACFRPNWLRCCTGTASRRGGGVTSTGPSPTAPPVASVSRGAWATAACRSCPIPRRRPAAARPSRGTAPARSRRTGRSGSGSVSRCSTCTPTGSRSPTWTTTGTPRTRRPSPECD